MQTRKHVASVEQLIAVFGSRQDAATQLECTIANLADFIRRAGVPSRYYLQHTQVLTDLGYTHDPALWGQTSAKPTNGVQEGVTA